MKQERDSEVEFILRNFDLQRDEHVEIEALRSLFRRASHAIPFTLVSPGVFTDALQQAQYTMTILQAHEQAFFDGITPAKREAMIVTSILGEHSINVDSYTNDSFYCNLDSLAPNLRNDVADVGLQVSILLEAESIMDVPMRHHEWFCFHVAALNKMRDLTARFTYLSPDERRDAASNADYLMAQFSKGGSYLSRYASNEVMKMQERLQGAQNTRPSAEIFAFPTPRR